MNRKRGCLLSLINALGLLHQGEEGQDDAELPIEAELLEELPYRIRDDFLSPAERSFFAALVTAVGERAIVCPKVSLGDVLFATDRKQYRRFANRINQQHVDFLLCSQENAKPLVAVELDDSSHERESAKQRDRFKDAACRAAGLPLVRIPARRTYDPQELMDVLLPYLQSASPHPAVPLVSLAEGGQPTCPRCGVPMVVRTATKGAQTGQQFYGCSNFPKCREVIPIVSGD